jgi:hypothetical protein
VLCAFEKLSGLKINFHKSELFGFGESKERIAEYVDLFGCKEGDLPFRYLGIPMSHRKLSNKDWSVVEERFQKKLSSWKGKLLSSGGRLVLINSILSSLPMFMMSFFRIPKGVLEKLDYYRSRFFWQCDEHKKKYRLARWSIMRKPKSVGGLGIINLEVQNKCLLSKWLFKLINEEGIWQDILKKKYLKGKTLAQVEKKKGDSHFWSGLMDVKNIFLEKGRFIVQDGTQTRFWEDLWIGDAPLKSRYPSLYNIVRKKNATVAQVFSTVPLNVSFRRALVGDNWVKWMKLVVGLLEVQLNSRRDTFVWNRSKTFSVRAMYNDLITRAGVPYDVSSWKAKVPLKIKIFLWYLRQGVILTKDNLAKRKWKGGTECCFCSAHETIQHLFFDCPVAWLIWSIVSITFDFRKPRSISDIFGAWLKGFRYKQRICVLLGVAAVCWAIWLSRNDVVFQRSKPNSCLQVIFRSAFWIRSWSILTKEEERRSLLLGSRRLEMTALEIFSKFGWNASRRITN